MSAYKICLSRREEIAEGTMAFHFEKPDNFVFKPGQAIDLILDNPSNANTQNARHTFSIVSAPFENCITVATRMRDSGFKRTLKGLEPGSAVQIDGPSGSLTLHNNRARPAVFVAGGIGITPFVSMLRQAAHDQLPQNLVLLYSNRRPEDTAFLGELQRLEMENNNFRLVATMTQMIKSTQQWTGETGLIGKDLVARVCGELDSPIYYLAGPPMMVEAMRDTLNLAGIDDDDIRGEEFFGY